VGFASTVAVALLFLALFWLMVRIAPRHDETVTDDLAGNQQRIARYQVKPREKPAEEPPKPREISGVPEGAKARDEEGKFGKRGAKKREAAPSRKGAPAVDADKRESDRRKVMKVGLVAALSKIGATAGGASNVLGPGGLGTGLNTALGGVKGRAGVGDAYGVGGLGSRGSGQGGGGTALGIGGLGTKGSGGGRGGYGEIDLGGRGKEETQFVPGRTIVVGGLSRDVINRIIQRHYNEVKYCYEKELTKDPGLYGKVTVMFVIDGAGRVGDALVQQSTMGSEPVESCIVSHVRRWAFPAPQGGSTVQVTYPYVFKSSAQ
jgi:TonB family protein